MVKSNRAHFRKTLLVAQEFSLVLNNFVKEVWVCERVSMSECERVSMSVSERVSVSGACVSVSVSVSGGWAWVCVSVSVCERECECEREHGMSVSVGMSMSMSESGVSVSVSVRQHIPTNTLYVLVRSPAGGVRLILLGTCCTRERTCSTPTHPHTFTHIHTITYTHSTQCSINLLLW
jgi:hypothetical protein